MRLLNVDMERLEIPWGSLIPLDGGGAHSWVREQIFRAIKNYHDIRAEHVKCLASNHAILYVTSARDPSMLYFGHTAKSYNLIRSDTKHTINELRIVHAKNCLDEHVLMQG